jgi:hydroxyacylglutathione hydrolase
LKRALIRIGIDNLEGYVSDIDKLEASGLNLEILNQISVEELKEDISEFKIIDVRSYTEFDISQIPGAINIHTGYLENKLDNISVDDKLVVYCTSGDRSAIAASYLLQLGYRNIYNLSGGINAWIQAGCQTERNNVKQMETTNSQ